MEATDSKPLHATCINHGKQGHIFLDQAFQRTFQNGMIPVLGAKTFCETVVNDISK